MGGYVHSRHRYKMDAFFLFILFIFFHPSHVSLSVAICTNASVQQCTAPLSEHNLANTTAIVPTFNESKMRQLCRSFDEVEDCLKAIREDCHIVDQKWFVGIERSYNYICDETFDVYLRHRPCLATPGLHVEGRQCSASLKNSLSSRSYIRGGVTYKRKRICQYARTYLDCVYNLVSSFCGEEAARWQRDLDEELLKPVLTLVRCHLDGDGPSTRQIIIIAVIVIGALLCLIGVAVAVFIHRRNKRARLENRPPGLGAQPTSNGTSQHSPRRAPASITYQNGTDVSVITPTSYPDVPPPDTDYPGKFEAEFDPPPYVEKEDPPPSYHPDSEAGAAGGVSFDKLPAKDRGPPDYHAPRPSDSHRYDDVRHASASASASASTKREDGKPRRKSRPTRSERHRQSNDDVPDA